MLSKETRERLPPLRGIGKHILLEATRKVDEVMNKIEVGNITELNDLVYAGAVVPDKKEAQEFSGSIWGERKERRKDTEWLESFKRDFEYKVEQEEVEIITEKIKKILRKMPNWKVPGPEFVQGFWLKNVKNIQEGLRRNLQIYLENGNVPMWMTKGRTILMQKDKEKGKAVSSYRPNTRLLLVWKLLTVVIAEETYGFWIQICYYLNNKQDAGENLEGGMIYCLLIR